MPQTWRIGSRSRVWRLLLLMQKETRPRERVHREQRTTRGMHVDVSVKADCRTDGRCLSVTMRWAEGQLKPSGTLRQLSFMTAGMSCWIVSTTAAQWII